MGNLFWLASYPKSGNTWVRMVLANLLLNRPAPLPINDVVRISFSDANAGAYARLAGKPVRSIDLEEALRIRPQVLASLARQQSDLILVKTHLPRTLPDGQATVDPKLTRGAIAIVRHPFDVAVSFADHYGLSLAQAAVSLCAPAMRLKGSDTQVPQFLGRWADHVAGWIDGAPFPLLSLRYEDMAADPIATFSEVAGFMGLGQDQERVARAVHFSSFDEMQRQETKTTFVERSRHARRFFRRGRPGEGYRRLAAEDRALIVKHNGWMMERLGYSDAPGCGDRPPDNDSAA